MSVKSCMKCYFFVDRSALSPLCFQVRIMPRQPLYLALFALLLLSACGGGSNTPAGPVVISPSNYPRAASVEQSTTAQNDTSKSEPKKSLQKRPYTKKLDDILAKRVAAPTDALAPSEDMSLYLRLDDSSDDNIASLLTEDYLKQFDIPIVFNDAVHYFVRYFTTEKRKIFANWLRRSKRYVPMIKEILRAHGLPEDLIYVAMIESGFNPKAYSSMKACGPWQFIYETGGRYGLRVNHWVDERRDPEKSTVAAALYLKDLFNQFGGWYLAAAAYNAGEKRIERSVEKYETADFWELMKYNTLPRETREYIPRLLAAALIAKDPERFGFTGINYDQPIRFVNEKVPGGVSLEIIAKAAVVDVDALRALNPELLTGVTPPDADEYAMKLPERVRLDDFREELRTALETASKVREATAYTLRKHESLTSVMKKYDVDYKELRLVNACDQELKGRPGLVVYIPRFDSRPEKTEVAREKELEKDDQVAVADATQQPAEEAAPARVASKTEREDDYRPAEEQRNVQAKPGRGETPRIEPATMNIALSSAESAEFRKVQKKVNLAGIAMAGATGPSRAGRETRRQVRLRLTSHVAGSEKPVEPAIYRRVKKSQAHTVAPTGHNREGNALKATKTTKGAAKRRASASRRVRISKAKVKPAAPG